MNIYIIFIIMKTKLTQEDIVNIINLYNNEISSTHKLAEKFKVGHKKIREILLENDIQINKKGAQTQNGNSSQIESSKINRYVDSNDYEYVAKCKKTENIIKDPNNLSGKLTKHIKEHYGDVWIPENNYQRKKYESVNNKKWFEEFFEIIQIEKEKIRKCKLCEWGTVDVKNKTGCFEQHIINTHQINIKDYLKKFPEDKQYHTNYVKSVDLIKFKNHVICKICNEKLKTISNTHLKNKHNMTVMEYKLKFPNEKIVSSSVSEKLSESIKKLNINLTPTWTSKGETEVKEFIESFGFDVIKGKNRKLLEGKEIDLIIEDKKICIEYNGLYYHTESMGKTSNYHLNKTKDCNQNGYKLIHIFEDEWITNKELVKLKIKHILGISDGIKIGGRNLNVQKISSEDKIYFLNKNHIQGSDKSKISYGAYYGDELVGVMTFNSNRNMTKNNNGEYELSRYATKQGYIIRGLASKFIKNFIKEYLPSTIVSFADRRWTLDPNNNLYTNLGFVLSVILKPNYYYYNSKINRYKRFHKFGFGKNNLKKRFPNLDFSKTEKELTSELGYSKIWDCGLFKYILHCKSNKVL